MDIPLLVTGLGLGGALVEGIRWLRERNTNKQANDTTLQLADKNEESRRQQRLETQVDNIYVELRAVEKENVQLQGKALTFQIQLEESTKREKEKDARILELIKLEDECEKVKQQNFYLRQHLHSALQALQAGLPQDQLMGLAKQLLLKANSEENPNQD